ncbi:hypothetical protein D5S17_09055 [Pseudonocardiaceae bacterium YIM PH 21723]|nr:hypothetical protein D5S17_09055 [Pseudonocardiaceae bacterium YIM PH 21723]
MTALVAVAAIIALVIFASDSGRDNERTPGGLRPPHGELDLAQFLSDYAGELSSDARYKQPTAGQRAEVIELLRGLTPASRGTLTGRAQELGLTLSEGADMVTGRRFVMAASTPGDARAWGVFLIDTGAPRSNIVVEVPHPNFDMHTELLGLDLYRKAPGSVLIMAGAHRKASNGKADVAHQAESMFHSAVQLFAEGGRTEIQVHGFDDDNMPTTDVVLSPGSADAGEVITRAGRELERQEFAVCRAWEDNCGKLEGTTNVQGKAAREAGRQFLHVETSRAIRDSDQLVDKVAAALAAAVSR